MPARPTATIRAGHPTAMARSLLLAAHGFVLSAHTMVDDGVTEADLDAELTTAAARSADAMTSPAPTRASLHPASPAPPTRSTSS